MGRRTVDSGIDGLFVIDKPAGMTSTDVVSRVRRLTGQRRCGHSGTLDPGATGVLLVALGQCTRLIQFLSVHTKSYTAELVLGKTTTTLDDEGDTVDTFEMGAVALEAVRSAAASLVGDILQIPPMVSAVQIDGKRLHQYAREGIEVERVARPVHVSRYEVHSTPDPLVFQIAVDCSTGTYVRVLAADVGEALGGGAHLRKLRRTAIGPFGIEESVPLDDQLPERQPLSASQMLAHLPQSSVDAATAALIRRGSVLPLEVFDGISPGTQRWRVAFDGAMIALYEPFRDKLSKPSLVLTRDQA